MISEVSLNDSCFVKFAAIRANARNNNSALRASKARQWYVWSACSGTWPPSRTDRTGLCSPAAHPSLTTLCGVGTVGVLPESARL